MDDTSFYDLYSQNGGVADDHAEAIQALLRGNQQTAGLAALSGAKGMQPFAQMTGHLAGQQQQLLAHAGEKRLALAMQREAAKQAAMLKAWEAAQQRQFQHGEKADQREWQAGQNSLLRAALQQRAETAAGAKAKNDGVVQTDREGNFVVVHKGDATATPVTAGAGAAPVHGRDRGLDADTQKLGGDLQYLSQMPADLEYVKSFVGKSKPGTGPLAGHMPEFLTPQKGIDLRKAIGRLLNAQIYMNSGKQINEAEMGRMAEAWLSKNGTSHSIDQGIADLERQMGMAANSYYAKYDPRVLDEYGSRGGFDTMGPFAPKRRAQSNTVGAPLTAVPPQAVTGAAPAQDLSPEALRKLYGL